MIKYFTIEDLLKHYLQKKFHILLIANPDLAIAAFQALKAEREKRQALEEAVAVQAQQIAELKPKATYYDVVLKCKDAVNISVITKDYGWSAQRMNEYLHKKGVQYKQFDILFSQIGISTFTS